MQTLHFFKPVSIAFLGFECSVHILFSCLLRFFFFFKYSLVFYCLYIFSLTVWTALGSMICLSFSVFECFFVITLELQVFVLF